MLLLIDNGHSLLFIGNNIHAMTFHQQSSDVEIPDHDCSKKISDVEKWIDLSDQFITSSENTCFLYPYLSINYKQDFKVAVWQPPKSA